MAKEMDITFINDAVRYDAYEGELYWRVRPRHHFKSDRGWRAFNSRFANHRAGTTSKTTGYVVLNFSNGDIYPAHRLIWAMSTGKWPDFIDHINGIRNDNRLANLRSCSRSQNQCNRGIQKNNTSGFKGIHLHSDGRWRAKLRANVGDIHIGLFTTPDEAHDAYVKATLRYHGEFAYAASR